MWKSRSFKMGLCPITRTPSPSPPKFLVFMKIGEICAQIREAVGVRGKFVLTKELGWILGGCTGALAAGRLKMQQQMEPVTGRTTYWRCEYYPAAVLEDDN